MRSLKDGFEKWWNSLGVDQHREPSQVVAVGSPPAPPTGYVHLDPPTRRAVVKGDFWIGEDPYEGKSLGLAYGPGYEPSENHDIVRWIIQRSPTYAHFTRTALLNKVDTVIVELVELRRHQEQHGLVGLEQKVKAIVSSLVKDL